MSNIIAGAVLSLAVAGMIVWFFKTLADLAVSSQNH